VKSFTDIIEARFISRPNRFVALCTLDGRTVRAYLPNPGRMWELLFPGVTLSLVALPPSPDRKLAFVVVAVERDGIPVMVHTHENNRVARTLIEQNKVPGLEGAAIVKQEHRIGHSRFDFLVRKDKRDILVEVKSCTLFHHSLSMFPDAISARSTKHLRELEQLSRKGFGAAVLFIVHSPHARFFMPEHHTDLDFCRALLAVKDRVMVRALGVGWEQDLKLSDTVRELVIPWDLVEREAQDRGNYLVILRLKRDRRIEAGSLGSVKFPRGYYCYVGSAMKDLTQRISRHQRLTKKKHWHIDHLREHAEFVAGVPIRSGTNREHDLASALNKIAGWSIPGFGCTDCNCATHLFGTAGDPLKARPFNDMLLRYRMGFLEEELDQRQ
jgi:sugar fermentation stimulation protein A